MTTNEDWWKGFVLGITVTVVLVIIFMLGSCGATSTKVISYPSEHRNCVVQLGIIQTCYPEEKK